MGGKVQQRVIKCFTALLYAAAAVGSIWLAVRFLLPWAAPFLLAFALAALLEPIVRRLVRRGWRRSAAAGLLTLALLGLTVWAAAALAVKAVSAATDFAGRAPALMTALGDALDRFEDGALSYIAAAPEGVADYLETAMVAVGDALYDLPSLLSQWALDAVGRVAQGSPDALLFIVTAGLGTYFLSASFPRALAFAAAQLPPGLRQRLEGLGRDLGSSFGGFLRAQLILMAMTFFELLPAFLLLGVEGAFGVAALTALIDALPVFGTGAVLAPWALYCLLLGNLGRGVGLLISWGVVSLVRSCAQAKLLGDQIGLDPMVSLIAIYVGWRVWRVWGMLLFPILFATVCRLNDKGVIRLWKNL